MIERSKVASVVTELLGSAVLTYAVLAISRSGLFISYFIATTLALAFGLMVVAFGASVKGYFNPVITLGLWSLRKLQTLEAAVYIAVQFLGAVGASALFVYLTDQKLQSIAERSFDWRVFIAEAAGAMLLGLGVAAAVYRRYDSNKAAVTVGLALLVGVVVAASAANGFINPAIALGLQSWSKSYILGPIAGAVVGMYLYSLLYAPAGSFKTVLAPVAASVTKKPAAKRSKAARKPAAKRSTVRRKK